MTEQTAAHRVVVTGGSGRLGRSVVHHLVETGWDVVSVDRVASAAIDCRQVQVDLTDEAAAIAVFQELQPEVVVHLAAIAVPFSAPEAVILQTNTALAWAVLTATVESGASALLAATSPTVIGYGAPTGWQPSYLPVDEEHPLRPWNAYALSKQTIEAVVATGVARDGDRVRFGCFRPCFVISPEEWDGAPTQQGHTVADRLADPSLAAVSLFNYVDARDAAAFVEAWITQRDDVANGSTFFVGAQDALARRPLAELIAEHTDLDPALASELTGDAPAFSSDRAERLLGWRATRSWRSELRTEPETEHASRKDQR